MQDHKPRDMVRKNTGVRATFKEREAFGCLPAIVESILKGNGNYRKEIGVLMPTMGMGKSMYAPAAEDITGRKGLLVYKEGLNAPSYLVVRNITGLPPEIIIEAGGQKMLLTLLQAPEERAVRNIVSEEINMGGGAAHIIPIMLVMRVMFEARSAAEVLEEENAHKNIALQNEGKTGNVRFVLADSAEVSLHGTGNKATVGKVLGKERKVNVVEKKLIEMVPEQHRKIVPPRVKEKKFRIMIVRGTVERSGENKETVFLFTEGNQINDLIDYVPAMLMLRPERIVVSVGGVEYYGAQIASRGLNMVLQALCIE